MDNNPKKNKTSEKPKIGITIGDYNGIGPEVIIKVLQDRRITELCVPIIYGSGKILTKYKRILEIEDFSYHQYSNNSYLNEKKVNVINCWADIQEIQPGKVTEIAGRCAYLAIKRSTQDLKSGFLDGVVTCPINKANIQNKEFSFPGHTEYYASEFAEGKDTLMLLCSPQMRVGVVTGHIPLKEVSSQLTKEKILAKIQILYHSLKEDFGIAKPKIAVLGLNPHAGENGLLGNEEKDILNPAITEFHKKGHLVYGPFPADGFFGSLGYQRFDAVLAMYHDQGLIPFKTLAFDQGVNYTAGLSTVRTSPDHGTAYDIAGKNKANEESFREALFMAIDVVKTRKNKVTNQLRTTAQEFRRMQKEKSSALDD